MNTGEFRSEKACYSACMSGVYDKLDSTQDVFQSISKRIPTLTLVQGQMCRKTNLPRFWQPISICGTKYSQSNSTLLLTFNMQPYYRGYDLYSKIKVIFNSFPVWIALHVYDKNSVASKSVFSCYSSHESFFLSMLNAFNALHLKLWTWPCSFCSRPRMFGENGIISYQLFSLDWWLYFDSVQNVTKNVCLRS